MNSPSVTNLDPGFNNFMGKLALGADGESRKMPAQSAVALPRQSSEVDLAAFAAPHAGPTDSSEESADQLSPNEEDEKRQGIMSMALQKLNLVRVKSQPSQDKPAPPSQHIRQPSEQSWASLSRLPPTPPQFKSAPEPARPSKVGTSMRSIMSKVGFASSSSRENSSASSAPGSRGDAPGHEDPASIRNLMAAEDVDSHPQHLQQQPQVQLSSSSALLRKREKFRPTSVSIPTRVATEANHMDDMSPLIRNTVLSTTPGLSSSPNAATAAAPSLFASSLAPPSPTAPPPPNAVPAPSMVLAAVEAMNKPVLWESALATAPAPAAAAAVAESSALPPLQPAKHPSAVADRASADASMDRHEVIHKMRTDAAQFESRCAVLWRLPAAARDGVVTDPLLSGNRLAKTTKGAKLIDEDVKCVGGRCFGSRTSASGADVPNRRKAEQALSAALRNDKRLKDIQEKNEEHDRRAEAIRVKTEQFRKDLLRECGKIHESVALLDKKIEDAVRAGSGRVAGFLGCVADGSHRWPL
jgi:hypothetical protein